MIEPTLLLDTTQPNLDIALFQDNLTLFSPIQPDADSMRAHSATLIPSIHTLLKEANHTIHDLKALAVNRGPGSFTGIRTGLTTIKLISQYLALPLFAFSTFELIASHPDVRNRTISIYLNGYRQQHIKATLKVMDTGEMIWYNLPELFQNSDPSPLTSQIYWIEPSLTNLLTLESNTATPLQDTSWRSTHGMIFFLSHCSDDFLTPWLELEPLYLQKPHISKPKTTSFKPPHHA